MANIDLTGKRFGKLLVLEKAYSKNYRVYWRCLCDCGQETFVPTSNLTRLHTTSCGCVAHRTKDSYKSLEGKVFGRLTVLEKDEERTKNSKRYRTYYKCLCECGNIVSVRADGLKNGAVVSCNCYHKEIAAKLNGHDLVGKVFGSLQVVAKLDRRCANGDVYWRCKCECGKEKEYPSSALLGGFCVHCGCKTTKKKKLKEEMHGYSHTALYRIWAGMRDRCTNTRSTGYRYYGAKGVKVCEEWNSSFIFFHEWAINNGYKEGLSIDRINPFGNYEPNNCRWVTLSEQAFNKRNSECNRELREEYERNKNV